MIMIRVISNSNSIRNSISATIIIVIIITITITIIIIIIIIIINYSQYSSLLLTFVLSLFCVNIHFNLYPEQFYNLCFYNLKEIFGIAFGFRN